MILQLQHLNTKGTLTLFYGLIVRKVKRIFVVQVLGVRNV